MKSTDFHSTMSNSDELAKRPAHSSPWIEMHLGNRQVASAEHKARGYLVSNIVSETRLQAAMKLLLVFAMHGMSEGNLLFAPVNPIRRTIDLCIQGCEVSPIYKNSKLK